MGKSDSIIFNEYLSMFDGVVADSVAFLGFSTENDFTKSLRVKHRDFFDLSLNNWNINDDWSLGRKYDLIISTRCPYFAKQPDIFIRKCKEHLTDHGNLLLDWGLGDHWRFPMYKVGWLRDGEHEYAYSPDNFLHSCFWRPEFQEHREVKAFWSAVVGRFGYNVSESLDDVIRREVPKIVDYDFEDIRFKFLWPDSPQLYIITKSKK